MHKTHAETSDLRVTSPPDIPDPHHADVLVLDDVAVEHGHAVPVHDRDEKGGAPHFGMITTSFQAGMLAKDSCRFGQYVDQVHLERVAAG